MTDAGDYEDVAPGVKVAPESNLTDAEIGAIQRATVDEDRELVTAPVWVVERARLFTEPSSHRPDLTAAGCLDEFAEHGTRHYEDSLGLYQRVRAPDPSLSMQTVVDEALANEDSGRDKLADETEDSK